MTRETKIGLLVGLGFIIVFAVLLSHTGQVPPTGDGKPGALVSKDSLLNQSEVGTLMNGVVSDSREPVYEDRTAPMSPVEKVLRTAEPVTNDEAAGQGPDSLPSPKSLDPPVYQYDETFDKHLRTVEVDEHRDDPASVHQPVQRTRAPRTIAERTAPDAVADPERQPTLVDRSQIGETTEPEADATRSNTDPAEAELKITKHTVQKGETLGEIVERHYGTQKGKILEWVVMMNKERIKNPNMLIAGQKIHLPPAPSDLTESGNGFATVALQSPSSDMDELIERLRKTARRAPTSSTPESRQAPSDRRNQRGNLVEQQEPAYEIYTVQPNDTLIKIAEDRLGSRDAWKKIRALNGDLDPKKMQVGDKIKVPRRPASSQPPGGERVSA